jgi:ABC transporter substrate binding protein (PQQ-dependent alcohol dehydrogenase system)
MITETRRAAALLLALGAWVGAACAGAARADDAVHFVYLDRDGDPAYAPHKAYTGLTLKDLLRPLDGAKLGIKDSRIIGRSLGLAFDLVEKTIPADADAAEAARQVESESHPAAVLLDLPLDDTVKIGAAFAAQPVILMNVRQTADRLRGADCSLALFHAVPSDAMLMDALAQYLYKQNWTKVLALVGQEPEDGVQAAAFQASAKKFGLKIVDVRPFVLSNNPRERSENNVRLLTGGVDYDVVFLADTVGEFGRYVPYETYAPRPVVGSEGLTPDAWDWTFERDGGPQLNQRFDKIAHRRMSGLDYAAWAGVRAVVEAIRHAQSTEPAKLRGMLTSDELSLDTYKGSPGAFRPWDQQLRQPILLHTYNAVIANAPIEGFLHRTNNLDTLGADQPETQCRMAK